MNGFAALGSFLCALLLYLADRNRNKVKLRIGLHQIVVQEVGGLGRTSVHFGVGVTNLSTFPVFIAGVSLRLNDGQHFVTTALTASDRGPVKRRLEPRQEYTVVYPERLVELDRYKDFVAAVVKTDSGETFELDGKRFTAAKAAATPEPPPGVVLEADDQDEPHDKE